MSIKVFSKFFSIGAICTLVQYAVLMLFVELFNTDAAIASSIGYLVGAIINYTANYYITFKSDAAHHEAVIKFTIVAAGGLGINYGLMHVLVNYLEWQYLIAQIVTTGIVFFYNFYAHKSWTYKS